MSETVFRYRARQRLVMWVFAVLVGAWAGWAAVRSWELLADHQTGAAIGLWLSFGLAPAVVCVVLVGMTAGVTRFDAEGLRTRGMTGRRRVAWRDVENIRALGGRGRYGTITQIGVTRTDGSVFLLPVPYSSAVMLEDPDLDEKLELMRREWKKRRDPGGE
ncbi:PH domain-containing protein [Streptomyces sp. NPDC093970]|uniref:PH domain-containing protein n=1 Tax=Streptomyces sp. NPDC093970 TaxID=3155076 RepID=UPI003415D6CD